MRRLIDDQARRLSATGELPRLPEAKELFTASRWRARLPTSSPCPAMTCWIDPKGRLCGPYRAAGFGTHGHLLPDRRAERMWEYLTAGDAEAATPA